MNNSTAEQAIRKVANSLINTHRPQLGACHSTAVEASLEALAELADELSLLDIYAELTKRLEILQGGQRPPVLVGSMPSGDFAFLKLFNEFAIANPRAADEWLFTDAKGCFTWQDDERGLVFLPPEVVVQLDDYELPFMDGPLIIGVELEAAVHDVTEECLFHPPFANELKGTIRSQKEAEALLDVMCILSGYEEEKGGAQ
ncbi:hypothetical protein BHR47_06100 [Aeromonas salmonicida subsp. salmonicida]|uniref:hypothetical protein n=1 Tax=Aeromonas salmonicida TaxID=645 RepID=UPI0009366C12|nr:hypothetical protein [Aeromonas salmonicida]OKB01073.1 hypothetical protein BHR47_06100 [Aeromonas salmonicida subsp. salmonicida]